MKEKVSSESILGNMLLIGGCGRSGTSILGSLVASCKYIEYFYDPAFFHKCMYKLQELNEHTQKYIWNAYLYDELFINNLSGRCINFKPKEITYVYNTKSKKEVDERIKNSLGRNEILHLSKKHKIAIKVTDSVFTFASLNSLYKNLKGLFIFRQPNDVISSLVKKGWFSNQSLNTNSPEPLIDFKIIANLRVPRWVAETDYDFWIDSDEINRCAYYYYRSNSELLKLKSSPHHIEIINYESLVRNPRQTAVCISDFFRLKPSKKTDDIITSIKPQKNSNENYILNVELNLQKEIIDLHMKLAKKEFQIL